MIINIHAHQVFVFGSNASGFHGAGSAGMACRGDARNTWRQDKWFLRALETEPGSPERTGKWAILGVARGFQEGKEGKSYAVETIQRPGWRRSTPLGTIYNQLVTLRKFIDEHPEWEFLITPLGEGYSGYTEQEMGELWGMLFQGGVPKNIQFVGREEGVSET